MNSIHKVVRGGAVAGALAVFAAGLPLAAAAEDGVEADRVVFGQSAAFEGPAQALGLGMRLGIEAAFHEANEAGGVHGRRFDLVSYDDSYEPDKAIANTNRLIGEDKVFALVGEVGTPTSKAAQPIATENAVPFFGPFTGAGFLRAPENRNVINVRGTYDAEAEKWIAFLTAEKKASRIAILYQDDSFGRVGLAGVTKALEQRGMKLVAEGTYKRNTTAVKSALLQIRKGEPDAIVMVGAYKPIAEFVKLAKKTRMDVPFVTISFVGSSALAKELGDDGRGVYITQVVPFPWNTDMPLVARYHQALKARDPGAEPGFVSFEGYIVGRLLVAAMEKAGPEPTRAGLLDAVYATGSFDLDGVALTFGEGDNQGMDEIFMTVIESASSFTAIHTGS
ncbi:ABC transporter substrate-binding protein [Minwuia thermotolerans]|uniref:ABC transporter substrate-binding protein n=1 Tax=Minwuia thermotolerans TaxID=2056226 RepID=A0A2M9FZT2_9PROT|nr:ABC transporter substrate-binding protein [Minwuia thermotolerans]PJK28972.1 ABC transporter substrate-binding protein [Minwuia thermotolerans]